VVVVPIRDREPESVIMNWQRAELVIGGYHKRFFAILLVKLSACESKITNTSTGWSK